MFSMSIPIFAIHWSKYKGVEVRNTKKQIAWVRFVPSGRIGLAGLNEVFGLVLEMAEVGVRSSTKSRSRPGSSTRPCRAIWKRSA
jgi:hypothetical protein